MSFPSTKTVEIKVPTEKIFLEDIFETGKLDVLSYIITIGAAQDLNGNFMGNIVFYFEQEQDNNMEVSIRYSIKNHTSSNKELTEGKRVTVNQDNNQFEIRFPILVQELFNNREWVDKDGNIHIKFDLIEYPQKPIHRALNPDIQQFKITNYPKRDDLKINYHEAVFHILVDDQLPVFGVEIRIYNSPNQYYITLDLCNSRNDPERNLTTSGTIGGNNSNGTFLSFNISQIDLLNPSNGFIVNKELTLTFKVVTDSSNSFSPYQHRNPQNVNIKHFFDPVHKMNVIKNTSSCYSGLLNQGATCYLNSMLQSLFHIPAFRKIVYEIPTTGNEDPSKCIPLCLQRLFGRMQIGNSPCSTKALTRSFGWDSGETWKQHDTAEFCRVLMDNLETKLKNTPLEGRIASLFSGIVRSCVKCTNINFETNKDNEFYEIPLPVRNCNTIEDSFREYTGNIMLDNDNKYETPNGLQDAAMHYEFMAFPPVLQLHFNRFDLIGHRETKLNSRLEFHKTLDLSPYLSKDGDLTKSATYNLFGVLVHKGQIAGGHYMAYLRTTLDDQWYKFNDNIVEKVSEKEAIEDNYGTGNSSESYDPYTRGPIMGDSGSFCAYVVIYVRKDDQDLIFEQIDNSVIPQHILDYISKPETDVYTPVVEKYTITIVSQESIQANLFHNKVGFINEACQQEIECSSENTNFDLYALVMNATKLDSGSFRLWIMNELDIPTTIIDQSWDKLRSNMNNKKIFIQKKNINDNENYDKSVYIYYCIFFQQLKFPIRFYGSCRLENTSPLHSLFKEVNASLYIPENVEYDIYEISETCCIKLNIEQTPEKLSLNTGTILVFQPKGLLNITNANEPCEDNIPNPDFYNNIEHVNFKDIMGNQCIQTVRDYCDLYIFNSKIMLFDYNNFLIPLKTCRIPQSITYDQLYQFILRVIRSQNQGNDTELQLYKKSVVSEQPMDKPMKPNDKLYDLFVQFLAKNQIQKLYYKFVDKKPMNLITNGIIVNIQYSENSIDIAKANKVTIPQNTKVHEMLNIAYEMQIIPTKEINYRIVVISSNKIDSVLDFSSTITNKMPNIRIEVIPPDQLECGSNDRIIKVALSFVNNDGFLKSQRPFLFKIGNTELLGTTKERIRQFLDISEEDFKFYKYVIGGAWTKAEYNHYLNDNVVLSEEFDKICGKNGNGKEHLYVFKPPEQKVLTKHTSMNVNVQHNNGQGLKIYN